MLLRMALWAAWVPPILYYLTVFCLGPFYGAEYSQARNMASELGIAGHPTAPYFNASAILSGVLMSMSAVAIAISSWSVVRDRWIGLPFAYACLSAGLSNIWAGMYPLPDPRHGMPPG